MGVRARPTGVLQLMARPALLVALLVVGASLAACGGDDDDDDVGAGPAGGVLSLAVETTPLVSGEPATWDLAVTNEGEASVVLTFRDGQDGDVVLRDGEEISYRWSAGRIFTLAIREVTMAPGETLELTLGDEALDVAAGTYEMEVSVVSTPAPEPVITAVTVGG